MKKKLFLLTFCLCLLFSGRALAGHGHYVNGVEGIKAASVPPPGTYWRMYNTFYNAGEHRFDDGSRDKNFDVSVYALVNRFVWTTNTKILGADWAMDAIVPLVYTDVSWSNFNLGDNRFGLGDIAIEPFILAWHGKRSDSVVGMGFYLPTGKFDMNRPASPGKGYWTLMLTAGTTQYFDKDKTWSASILARYETHTDQRNTDTNLGDDFHFEWGIGKKLNKTTEVGLAGYCYWQLGEDKGQYAMPGKQRVFAAGPEINLSIAKWKADLCIRSLWEFGAKNTSQGNLTTINFTKAI